MTGPLNLSPEARARLFADELTHAAHKAEQALGALRARNPGVEWAHANDDVMEARHTLSCALSRVWPENPSR